jgi:hypothetical protein
MGAKNSFVLLRCSILTKEQLLAQKSAATTALRTNGVPNIVEQLPSIVSATSRRIPVQKIIERQ